jgi:hypothetical protein
VTSSYINPCKNKNSNQRHYDTAPKSKKHARLKRFLEESFRKQCWDLLAKTLFYQRLRVAGHMLFFGALFLISVQ